MSVSICPFCKKSFNKVGIGAHFSKCKDGGILSKDERFFEYLRSICPFLCKRENLIEVYEKKLQSIPDIKKSYGISFRAIVFLLGYYGIKKRGISESAEKISKHKYKKTCYERYGVKNTMCSGTEFILKRNKTIQNKFGVDNVFKLKEMQKYAKSEERYQNKHGKSRKEVLSIRAKKSWESKSDEEKQKWLESSILSDRAINNNIRKGYISSGLESKVASALEQNGIQTIKQFTIKISKTSRRHYDLLLFGTKILIEVNGDYWHANPTIYKSGDLVNFPWGKIPADTVWAKDKKKMTIAKSRGYVVIYLWESEMKGLSDDDLFGLIIEKVKEKTNADGSTKECEEN